MSNLPCRNTNCVFCGYENYCHSISNATCERRIPPAEIQVKYATASQGKVVTETHPIEGWDIDLFKPVWLSKYLQNQEEETKVEPAKTYPHKYFVQFFRSFFQIPTGEMKEYTDDKGKIHKYSELAISRTVTFCVINPVGSTDYYQGLSVLNPRDNSNDLTGAKEALQSAVQYFFNEIHPRISYSSFAKAFFDAFLKKAFTKENVLKGNGFVLKVRLPFEYKKRR